MSLSQNEKSKFKGLIDECDQLIRAGKINQVASLISRLNFSRVPRTFRQSLAKICRRAVLVSQGLRLLQPIVRSEKPLEQPATSGEICEYAVLLLVNGSVREALELLSTVDATSSPEAFLYKGFCQISQWDCVEGATSFQNFLQSTPDEYSKLIGRVNLASCYSSIFQLDQAEELLKETIEMAEKAGAQRLVGNCYELCGQVYFWKEDFERARQACDQALQIFGQSESYDQLMVLKTMSAMSALENKSLEPLIKFREQAVARKHWNCVREADLFSVKVRFDQKKLDHVIFGTPMPMYRQRIEKVIGAQSSEFYLYGSDSPLVLDLQSGKLNQKTNLNPGKKQHKVFAALLRDFYVPLNSGAFFSEVYPDEYYNSETSPYRMNQLIMRTRSWLKSNQVPASIEQIDGAFRLVITGKFGIRITRDVEAIDSFAVRWKELKTIFPAGQIFSADEARKKLNLTKSMFFRLSDWALKAGELKKTGQNRSTQYEILTAPTTQPIKKVS